MEDLERKLGKVSPAIVRVTLANGEIKDMRPPTGTRKRWQPITKMLGAMEWRRVELLDARGAVLDMIDNAQAPTADLTVRASDDPTDRHLKRMIDAQREALTWQDKSVRAALDTCVQVMAQMGEAVHGIVELHRAQNESLRRLLREAQEAAPPTEGMPQDAILAALAPELIKRLMTAATPTGNG